MKIVVPKTDPNPFIAGKTYYTTPDIAKMMGRTSQSVRNWIEAKKLPAIRVGHVWFVSEEDFIDNVPAYMRKEND